MRLLKEKRIRAPELTPTDWAAEAISFPELSGRVVLLDFFSFGDPEGICSLPRIRALADHYREAGLTVVGVHVPAYEFERPIESARQEIWRLGLPYPVALDHGFEIFRDYENQDLPARHVVDANGFARGWHGGPGGLVETEKAIRALLREAGHLRLAPPLEPDDRLLLPGELAWLPSAELRFGTRAVGFGLAPEVRGEGPDAEGKTRELPEMPEARAEGHAYLEGRWTLGSDAIRCDSAEGACAVVFQGCSIHAVLSAERSGIEQKEPDPVVEITLDGEPLSGATLGADVEVGEDGAFVRIERGRVYELISSAEFGIHNLDLRFRSAGTSVHLLSFGTNAVPETD